MFPDNRVYYLTPPAQFSLIPTNTISLVFFSFGVGKQAGDEGCQNGKILRK
jgi:hypothetical protein